MDAHTAILTRGSVRDYLSKSVTRDLIDRIINAAIHAPTAANRQGWHFTVISDRSLLDEISNEAKSFMTRERPVDLPVILYDKLATTDFNIFYHAPLLIVVSGERDKPWIAEECALAAQNMMLWAHAEGLGSCWIGLCQPYLATQAGKDLLGLPPLFYPFSPVIFGYPDGLPKKMMRVKARTNIY
jgi:nitroreductase